MPSIKYLTGKKISTAFRLILLRFQENIRFNKKVSVFLLSKYAVDYCVYKYIVKNGDHLRILGNIFRHININTVRQFVQKQLVSLLSAQGAERLGKVFFDICSMDRKEVERLKVTVIDNERLFDKRLLILSPPINGKKGVLVIKFTNYFKYVLEVFDIEKLNKDYIIVLEPSSCGYFDEDILCMLGRNHPVIVQTPEKVDRELLNSLKGNLIPIGIGANYWVDDRVFYPINNMKKEYDVIMVAIWGSVKRHHRLFQALSKIPPAKRPKIALVGVSWPMTLDEIIILAKYYNVCSSITFYENLSQEQINLLLNKSKLTILLSKKEGFNKSIIEAMFANIPAFILHGHNFGDSYPYINECTGGYIHDKELSIFLENIDETLSQNRFTPRTWVERNMSAKSSTSAIAELLKDLESGLGLSVNYDIAIKINNPNLDYYDYNKWGEYSTYYMKLKDYIS